MSKHFNLRVEYLDGTHKDTVSSGETLDEAKVRYERAYPNMAPFEWHGAVCFVQGNKPAENKEPKQTNPWGSNASR